MKKTIALILAIIMMAAFAVPAFAETPAESGVTSNDDAETGDNICTVTYGVSQTYTISLPTAVNFAFGTQDQVATLGVTDFVINGANKLVITMDSANEGTANGWKMLDVSDNAGSTAVPYTVTLGNKTGENVTATAGPVANAVVAGEVKATTVMEVASNVAGAGGSVDLTFETEGTKQAGEYSDQITFGVSIVAI